MARKKHKGASPRPVKKVTLGPAEFRSKETLEELLARLKIDDWDYLLVGDGSGCEWEGVSGWGCISIARASGERRVWMGCVNRGSVNLAELQAYLTPLDWIVHSEEKAREEKGTRRRIVRVHIVTDSDYCRHHGSSKKSVVKNAGAWTALAGMKRQGVITTWHHVKRETVELNILADALSKHARLLMLGMTPGSRKAAMPWVGNYDADPHHYNPDEEDEDDHGQAQASPNV